MLKVCMPLCTLILLFCSCKASPPRKDFYSGNYEAALVEARKTVAEHSKGKNYAYHRLFLASTAFAAGKYKEAQTALLEALKVMESYGGASTKEMMALVGSEKGKVYKGKVVSIVNFGLFVSIYDKEGLCHISEISHDRVENLNDLYKIGDEIEVKVLDINDRGQIKLSRKVLLDKKNKS